jgi:ABC-type branched-subunit amino acid transport system ATPase component
MYKLRFIELIVIGYDRLALSDDKTYTITPSNIHLILGTNGSGKSSLLELMTPLPPNRKDFIEGGSKKITFKYEDDVYIVFSQDNKHSVYKNNEVVIEHAGVKQLEMLCKEYFNITPQIHKFMLGKLKITSMSLSDRKDFITSISNIDYDYANKLYSNLKKRLRDEIAISKHLNNKLLALKEYILNEDEVKSLASKKDSINNAIYKLYEQKVTLSNPIMIDKQFISNLVYRTDDMLREAIRIDLFNNIDTLKNELAVTKSKKVELEQKRDLISNKLFEMSKLMSSNTVEADLNNINNRLSELNTGRLLPIDNDIVNSIDKDSMMNLLDRAWHIKHIDRFTIESNYKTFMDKKNKLLDEKKKIELEISNLNSMSDAYVKIPNTVCCTNCNTPIVTEAFKKLVFKMYSDISSYNTRIDDIHKEINALSIDDGFTYTPEEAYESYTGLIYNIGLLGLNKYISSNHTLKEVYDIINQISIDYRATNEILELEKRKKEILELSNNLLDEEAFSILELEYDNIKLLISNLNTKEVELSKSIDTVSKINKNIEDIKSYLSNLNKNRKRDIKLEKNKAIDTIIIDLKTELNNVNLQLDRYNHTIREEAGIMTDLTKSLNDIKLLEIMIDELSPATGLIADSIKSFLVNYIDEVNDIINSVWSYRLDVMPYDIKDLDKGITYRFPVRTVGADNSDDINNTSESMNEIISLAFRLVSLKYMGLEFYPLMIDEFGRSMDEVHLIKSYDLLEEMVETMDIQMFVIAHIKTAYARFNNAGISIISNLNLENM